MSSASAGDGGIPRRRGQVAVPPGQAAVDEDWRGANDAMKEKLRRNSLQRQARQKGLELRHSDYGYALIDTARELVDGRSDLTLAEVASLLKH